jgi:hypothetical protein
MKRRAVNWPDRSIDICITFPEIGDGSVSTRMPEVLRKIHEIGLDHHKSQGQMQFEVGDKQVVVDWAASQLREKGDIWFAMLHPIKWYRSRKSWGLSLIP